jgi:hypothetical protein
MEEDTGDEGKMRMGEAGLQMRRRLRANVSEGLSVHRVSPGLYTLKGELFLRQLADHYRESTTREAEVCFQDAITLARNQEAKGLELQAVIGLSQLWQRQGKKEAARKILMEIYGWFTEGFGSPDLQQAQALLAELS